MNSKSYFDIKVGDAMRCGHVFTDTGNGNLYHLKCSCCRLSYYDDGVVNTDRSYVCGDCHDGYVEKVDGHLSFRYMVEIAPSVGVCFLCGSPHGTMRFIEDDSVHICERCVK
jgi:hypothetical protein